MINYAKSCCVCGDPYMRESLPKCDGCGGAICDDCLSHGLKFHRLYGGVYSGKEVDGTVTDIRRCLNCWDIF